MPGDSISTDFTGEPMKGELDRRGDCGTKECKGGPTRMRDTTKSGCVTMEEVYEGIERNGEKKSKTYLLNLLLGRVTPTPTPPALPTLPSSVLSLERISKPRSSSNPLAMRRAGLLSDEPDPLRSIVGLRALGPGGVMSLADMARLRNSESDAIYGGFDWRLALMRRRPGPRSREKGSAQAGESRGFVGRGVDGK
ncbi:hypothetical protein TREMEDRAFT_61038 [Tremella mesenterica DSM 1558]|uniref:uncharacterized protein n=1 Tax=Tremella mesenterica (strain ATCC 24925 / CBS 8224 / DSM 1558 / NBRC 9311 / NRRL Y-6157 / RJB 2259-6 / UBC 559-6) TaxID=578456 RepID=UPI0003F4A3B3|nr:uncharacterized protein TREMEDRAFT_61038 [Tremella mesenterica DSM 1558]EIW70533.1 hypothetical protein TREMEDRAFT_61038 [Tremella mesenterica DSM 1558]